MKHKNILLIVFLLNIFAFQPVQAIATVKYDEKPSRINVAPANQVLYNTIYVKMYKLVPPDQPNSGAILPSQEICIYPIDFNTYGCGSEYPDSDIREPEGFFHVTEQYYLRNVLPNEMNFAEITPDAEALKAQAVAARTVANWKSIYAAENIRGFQVINNSTQYQVFIPGTYSSYSSYQDDIDGALNATTGQYLNGTHADGTRHILDAEFSSDIEGTSGNGGQPYLTPVGDPISTCDLKPYGNGWGMSQRGAIRWARGNVCPNGLGSVWPVKWDYKQILVHYYTGIDIVDDSTGNKIAPDDRWNLIWHNIPLDANRMGNADGGQTYGLNIQLQNTSTSDWVDNNTKIGYQWTAKGAPATGAWSEFVGVSVPATNKGALLAPPVLPLTMPSSGGDYTLHLDLYRNGVSNGGKSQKNAGIRSPPNIA